MINEKLMDRQQRLEQFRQHLEEARKLQDDILKYGLNAAYLYVEDVDGDWLEKWGENEEEKTVVESVTFFLESNDWVAVRVRKQLKDKSLREIAAELEKCLSLPEEENRIFAVKNVLVGSDRGDCYRDSSDEHDDIDLLYLAEELLEKLADVVGEQDMS